jgi:hypothetical protein
VPTRYSIYEIFRVGYATGECFTTASALNKLRTDGILSQWNSTENPMFICITFYDHGYLIDEKTYLLIAYCSEREQMQEDIDLLIRFEFEQQRKCKEYVNWFQEGF